MRAFMDDPEEPETSVAACRLLRSKTAFGATHGYSDWRVGGATAAYWCLRTMTTSGPDDDLAHPDRCQVGRACYRADT